MSAYMIAGNFYLQLWFRDSDGYPVGQNTTPDSKANGTLYDPYLVKHLVSIDAATFDRIIAQSRGGQKLRGQRDLGPAAFPTITFTLSDRDETLDNYIRATSSDTTATPTLTAPNLGLTSPPQMSAAFVIGATPRAGADQFITLFYPNVQISGGIFGSSQDGGENPNPLTYTMTPRFSTLTGAGFTFADTSLAVADDEDIAFMMRGTKPYSVSTYVLSGSSTGSFGLPYQPTGTTIGTGDVLAARNGVQSSGSSFVTSVSIDGTVTFTTGGAAGQILTVAYPTDFVETS